ncbi:MAG: large repetitive protein, partial [Thermoleophilaceae bacterium]|nr:large repetitive protein [Thermoleophilaceae bacterium]
GIDCGANCSGTFDDGTALSLTANAAPGSTFDGWTGSCSGGAQMCNLTMSADRSATATFTSLDHTPPDTTIDSAPPALTNSRSVTFAFSASEPGSTFECRFDGAGGFGPCTSPLTYGPVTDGSHGLEVRAVDAAQNADPTPAARAFTVDATPPETTLDSGPSGTIGESAATFTFSSSEPGSTFTCRLDAIPWAACPSPMGYSGLPDGLRLFEVSATDAAGNTDPTPATRQFTVATGGSDPIAVVGFGPKPGLGQALRRGVPLVYSCRLACSITAGIEPSAAAVQRFGFAAGGRIARGSSSLGAAGAKKFKVRFKGSARRKLRRARSLRGTVIATATSPGILGAERHMGAIRLRR